MTEVYDRDDPILIDCTEGAGEIMLSDLTSVTIFGLSVAGENTLSISGCREVSVIGSEITNTSLDIASDQLILEDCQFRGCSIYLDTWSDSDLLNSTFHDTTIRIENKENLTVENSTFLNSTLWLTDIKNFNISENSFVGSESRLKINISFHSNNGLERNIFSNIFESCTPGLHFVNEDFRGYISWYNIYDNNFRNCSMAIVSDLSDWRDNRIWRNTFYHNGGTGDNDS
ncbi:MAG: hypothetical protein ACMUHY_02420, partial [Thermoplasmatota archaeon]